MNIITLLDELKDFTVTCTSELIMPVRMQKGDTEQTYRAADVYRMWLKHSSDSQKVAPYIIHQFITGNDSQKPGNDVSSKAEIRSIYAVYNEDEQEGKLMLLNLMERVRINLLATVIIGGCFELDLEPPGIERIIYPENTAPYYAGEMATIWKLPVIKRRCQID